LEHTKKVRCSWLSVKKETTRTASIGASPSIAVTAVIGMRDMLRVKDWLFTQRSVVLHEVGKGARLGRRPLQKLGVPPVFVQVLTLNVLKIDDSVTVDSMGS
jgi:hypothetical protein